MAPVTTNRSVRLQNDLWSWITEEAERRGVTVNGLIADLLIVARLRADEARLAPPKPAKPKPSKIAKPAPSDPAPSVSVPYAGNFRRPVMQKKAK